MAADFGSGDSGARSSLNGTYATSVDLSASADHGNATGETTSVSWARSTALIRASSAARSSEESGFRAGGSAALTAATRTTASATPARSLMAPATLAHSISESQRFALR